MKNSENILEYIFSLTTINTVLDLGPGRGKESVRCANHNAKVHAVDLLLQPPFEPVERFYSHPNISFFRENIANFLNKPPHDTQYELIILYAVLPFLEKNFFETILLPFANTSLRKEGLITFSYFLPDDSTFKSPSVLLSKNDFSFLERSGYSSLLRQEERIDDDHPPVGPHKHHRGLSIVQKTF